MSTSISNPAKDQEVNIRLRRLPSSTSLASNLTTSTAGPPPPVYASTSSLNPFLSPEDDTASITSSAHPFALISNFEPTYTFHISTLGKPRLSLPTPVRDLTIPILSPTDSNIPVYISTRPSRSSGSCVLTRGSDISGETALSRTTYQFGPGNPPKVQLSAPDMPPVEFTITSTSMFSRAVAFDTGKGKLTWRYASSKERRVFDAESAVYSGTNNLLLLEREIASESSGASMWKGKRKPTKELVARLIRGEGTRTEGSKGSCAGNGGVLEIGDLEEEGEEMRVLVVTTALVMLKKEIDRMRAVQAAAIGAAVSGGA